MKAPIAVCAAFLVASAISASAQENCAAGNDLVVQALESMRADSTPDQLLSAKASLKRATELCGGLGSAFYYLSLVEDKLGRSRAAEFAMKQAKMFPSEPMKEGLNPFVLSSPKGNPPLGRIQRKWALIIGLDQFEDKSIPGLAYGVADAKSMAATLIDPKYGKFPVGNVHVLLNEKATTIGIKEEINWLARSAKPDDLVLIYVATHGSPRDMDVREANYLVTYDTRLDLNSNKEAESQDHLYATGFPMVEFSDAIATRIVARRAALLIDTCFSGAATSGRDLKPAVMSERAQAQAVQGAGRVVIAAASREQESQESKSLQHGYFTYYLVEAMKQINGDAPIDKVFDYVRSHVSQQAAQDNKAFGDRYAQTPVMSRSSDDTNFPLASAPADGTPGAIAAGQQELTLASRNYAK